MHPYVEWLFAVDPLLALDYGAGSVESGLGNSGPDALADKRRRRLDWLTSVEARPAPAAGTTAGLEHRVLLTELRVVCRRDEVVRPEERAPYWYIERLGRFLTSLAGGPTPESVLVGLRAVPDYLAAARRCLTSPVPPAWAEMAVASAAGLRGLVNTAVTCAPALPEAVRLGRETHGAIDDFVAFAGAAAGDADPSSWAVGRDHVAFLLRELHHVDGTVEEFVSWAHERVRDAERRLDRAARYRRPGVTWREQINDIKSQHPPPGDIRAAYEAEVESVWAHTVAEALVSVPAGSACPVAWTPAYRREGLPLGVMDPVPPYGPGRDSSFLLTPVDPAAAPAAQRDHLRDNCWAFIASIVGHETVPGHHLQAAVHKASTSEDSFLRFFSSSAFVEGWGLYVEHLLSETGYFSSVDTSLVSARNELWRALRVVVDVGLHTATMTVPEAEQLFREAVGMGAHMARGEVRRYTRHDNPTYPSSYLLGRDQILGLRRRWERRHGSGPTNRRSFHDWLLSHGSPPPMLLAPLIDCAAIGTVQA